MAQEIPLDARNSWRPWNMWSSIYTATLTTRSVACHRGPAKYWTRQDLRWPTMIALTFRYRNSCASNWVCASSLMLLAEEILNNCRNTANFMRYRNGLQSCEPRGLCVKIHQTIMIGDSILLSQQISQVICYHSSRIQCWILVMNLSM